LKNDLHKAVELEEYEEAAQIRDRILKLERFNETKLASKN